MAGGPITIRSLLMQDRLAGEVERQEKGGQRRCCRWPAHVARESMGPFDKAGFSPREERGAQDDMDFFVGCRFWINRFHFGVNWARS